MAHDVYRLNRREGDLCPKSTAKDNFVRLQQRLALRFLFPKARAALHFAAHKSPFHPQERLRINMAIFNSRDAQLLRCPNRGNSKLINPMATAITNRIDWTLIWAQ